MEEFALTVLGLVALSGWFLLVATVAAYRRRLAIYKTVNRTLRDDLDIARRDLRHCRAELTTAKAFGRIDERNRA